MPVIIIDDNNSSCDVSRIFSDCRAMGGLFLLWLLTGTLVYHWSNNFTWSNSFYYAVNTGLGIGSGELYETSNISRVYSCFHMLMGGVFMSSLFSMVIEQFIILVQQSTPTAPFRIQDMFVGFSLVILWLIFGTLTFGFEQNMPWLHALEYSTSVITTTGNTGLQSTNNVLGNTPAFLSTFYSLLGVAIYVYTIKMVTHYMTFKRVTSRVIRPFQP